VWRSAGVFEFLDTSRLQRSHTCCSGTTKRRKDSLVVLVLDCEKAEYEDDDEDDFSGDTP